MEFEDGENFEMLIQDSNIQVFPLEFYVSACLFKNDLKIKSQSSR